MPGSPVEVVLYSCDGEEFRIPEPVASRSQTVKNMLEDTGPEDAVPLPNVHGRTLSLVVDFCKRLVDHEAAIEDTVDDLLRSRLEDDLGAWKQQFIDVDQAVLYELIMAANYLNVADLLDLCCKEVARLIKGKSPDEIRTYFHIKNDFSPQEEEEVRRENQWAFE